MVGVDAVDLNKISVSSGSGADCFMSAGSEGSLPDFGFDGSGCFLLALLLLLMMCLLL
jgi:hypothetical protein